MKNILEDPEVISQLALEEEESKTLYRLALQKLEDNGDFQEQTRGDICFLDVILWKTFVEKCVGTDKTVDKIFRDFMRSGLTDIDTTALDSFDERGIYYIKLTPVSNNRKIIFDTILGFRLHKKTWDAFKVKFNIKYFYEIKRIFTKFVNNDLSIISKPPVLFTSLPVAEAKPTVIDIKPTVVEVKPTQIEIKQPVVEVKQPVAETTNVRSISKIIAPVTTDDLNKITVFLEQHGIFNVSVREINKNNIRASFNLEKRGIYMLFSINVDVIPIYIGKSKNIKQRWITHHRYNEIQLLAKINQLFAVFIVEDEFLTFNDLEQSEAKLIQLLNPILNKTEILL